MDPKVSAITIPNIPDSEPMSFDIISGFNMDNEIPTRDNTVITDGTKLVKDFQAFFMASLVLFRSLTKEKAKKDKDNVYNIMALIRYHHPVS